MTQREGPAPGGAVAATRPTDGPPSVGGLLRSPATPRAFEAVYPTLATHQQQALLEQAGRQGFLLTNQIPPAAAPATDHVRPILHHAFAERLPPAPLVEPIVVRDAALDDVQRDAVARALHTPDLFLLQGPAGTGKTRIALELVRQVVGRGGRVLLLSPDPAALDDILPHLAVGRRVVRRLRPGEVPDRLAPAVAALTANGHRSAVRAALLDGATAAVAAAEGRVRKAESVGPVWDEWSALRDRQAARAAARDGLTTLKESLAEHVRREAETATEPFPYYVQRLRGATAAHSKRIVAFDAVADELTTTRTAAAKRLQAAEAECHDLRPKADALQHGRWYTLGYWKARGDDTLAGRLTAAETGVADATAALAEMAVREQKLASDRRLSDEELAADRARILDGEISRRLADLEARLAAIECEIRTDEPREKILLARLGPAPINREVLDSELADARRELAFARDWSAEVATRTDELVREACADVAVVAGPVADIGADPELTASASELFDLLVIDDAHRLPEADFLAAARLARKWVLLGEPADIPAGRLRAPRPDLFARLSFALAHEVWGHDGGRLVCRLHPVRGADRRRLECEPVADAPEIELRIFAPPGADPMLAEVAFPGETVPAVAREYLFRELGEITCQPRARTARCERTADGLTLRYGPADAAPVHATIGNGVREELAGLESRAVHFSADWTPEAAIQWAAENVGRRDSGRLVILTRPYRACPGLARWLNLAFAAGFAVPAGDEGVHVEFLAVPDLDARRRREPAGRPGRVGGAGYEIDLADARQRAALPADLRDLPATGFVNVPEAQALVRYLEAHPGTGIAVTSPFPAQVALLHRLVGRSGRLAQVRVLDPASAVRHECDLLAVSLTRSHVARAVSFGESPGVLADLLGRARKRVLFAGDPGTLARRLQWEGPVDHLDAADAARERGWVAALADCPRVTPPRPRPTPAENARV